MGPGQVYVRHRGNGPSASQERVQARAPEPPGAGIVVAFPPELSSRTNSGCPVLKVRTCPLPQPLGGLLTVYAGQGAPGLQIHVYLPPLDLRTVLHPELARDRDFSTDEPVSISLLLAGSGSCYCPKCHLIAHTTLSWPSLRAPPHPDSRRGQLFISAIVSILALMVNPGQPLLPSAVCRRQPSPGSNRCQSPSSSLPDTQPSPGHRVWWKLSSLTLQPIPQGLQLPSLSPLPRRPRRLHLLTEGRCHRLHAAVPAVNVDCVLARH